MADVGYPRCPGCGGPPARARLFCRVCVADIAPKTLTAIDTAWKALAKRPASSRLRADYDAAVAAAAGEVHQ